MELRVVLVIAIFRTTVRRRGVMAVVEIPHNNKNNSNTENTIRSTIRGTDYSLELSCICRIIKGALFFGVSFLEPLGCLDTSETAAQ